MAAPWPNGSFQGSNVHLVRIRVSDLECAPVPVAGYTERNLGLALAWCRRAGSRHGTRRDGTRGHGPAALLWCSLTDHARRRSRALAASAAAPQLEVAIAVGAGAAQLAARVVICALV